jgi:hypothetical protein
MYENRRNKTEAICQQKEKKGYVLGAECLRCGSWTYIAALYVHHAKIFGRCPNMTPVATSGSWTTVSSHLGVKPVQRLRERYRRLMLVHAPVHGSWLNLYRSRSTSRLCSARCSRPMTLPISPTVYSIFSTTGKDGPPLRIEV